MTMTCTQKVLYIVWGYLAVIHVVTFFLYGIDKWKAKRSKWRIEESTLIWRVQKEGVSRKSARSIDAKECGMVSRVKNEVRIATLRDEGGGFLLSQICDKDEKREKCKKNAFFLRHCHDLAV